MKYLIPILIVVIVSLSTQSCKDDREEGTLTLHFKAVYGDQPLSTFSTQSFDAGQQIQFTHLSMLLSDIQLNLSSGGETLAETELVDLSFDEASEAMEGFSVSYHNIPARSYSGIEFGVGVPPDVNQMKPADFPSTNPLSKTGYYWVPWDSYIFMKVEGRLDSLGTNLFDTGFTFHTGSDPLYRILESGVPLTIEDGEVTQLTIEIDYEKVLQGIDIKSNPQNHNPEDVDQILQIVNNLANSITLIL